MRMNPSEPATHTQTEATASHLYTIHSTAAGGVAFNGDPFPTWAEFSADPAKKKQADAWRVVATVVGLMEDIGKPHSPFRNASAGVLPFGCLHFPDEASLRMALNAPALHTAAWDFGEWLRSGIKHGSKPWDEVRAKFLEDFEGLLER